MRVDTPNAEASSRARRLISFVCPVFNESGNLRPLHLALTTIAHELDYTVQFLFVNDGSTDDSLAVLESLHAADSRVEVVDLSRNFGHQIAVTAGLDRADGDAVIIMDSDLQDPPAVALELIARWEEGWDVVYAQRRSRKDSLFKRATASVFYSTLTRMSEVDIPRNTGDFRLLDRRVVAEIRRYPEKDRFIRGMVSHVGFDQTAVQFDRDERLSGDSGYPLRSMIKLASDGIFGFSTLPLRLISRIGYLASALSVVGIIYVLAVKIFRPEIAVAGWAFIVMSILLMGGLQLIMLGILGQYIGRIYRQVQDRPMYSVKRIMQGGNDSLADTE